MKSQARFESPLLFPAHEADDLCCYGKGGERELGDVGGFLEGGEVVIASGVGGRGRWGRRSGTEAEANCHMKDNENANVGLGYCTTT